MRGNRQARTDRITRPHGRTRQPVGGREVGHGISAAT